MSKEQMEKTEKEEKSSKKVSLFKRLFCNHIDGTLTIMTLHSSNSSYHTHVCKVCGKAIPNPNRL